MTTISAPDAPTIIINTPGAGIHSMSAPALQPAINLENSTTTSSERPYDPVIDKIIYNVPIDAIHNATNGTTSSDSCYLCDEQNPGDFSPTTKFLDACLLCSRSYCPIHKSSTWEQVCNINHSKYYHECLERVQEEFVKEGRTDPEKREAAEKLIQEGIFPSLGEREKAIFMTSPVSPSKQQELESFRSLDATLSNGTDARKQGIVEEKDFVGADIAV